MSAFSFPRRIVCLQPSATVTLAELGELDRVVACTRYCAEVVPELRTSLPSKRPPEARSGEPRNGRRLIIADSWTSKSAEILAAQPDLVIASVPYQEAAVVEILKAGIRFIGLAPRTLADIYMDIAVIAGAAGASERGARVISGMREEIDAMKRRTAGLPRKRVFCEEWGKPIIASQPWVAELVHAAGGEFLGKPGTHYSAKDIAEMNPDIIITSWCGAGDRVPLEKMVITREWSGLDAVLNSHVYCISDELLNTPAPTLVPGLHALAGAIHPGEFGPQHGLRSITQVPQPPVQIGK